MRKCMMYIVLMSVFALAATVSFANGIPIGVLTYVEGRVDILDREESAIPVVREDEVWVGDSVRTKSFSKAEIKFNDGSVLRLAPNTRVLIEEFKMEEQVRQSASLKLFRGKIKTLVSKVRGETNFFVKTPNMDGSIKGSSILISYGMGQTNVFVKEGGISVNNPLFPDEAVKIRRGEAVSIPTDAPPSTKRDYLDIEMKMHSKDTDPLKPRVKPKEMQIMEGWIVKLREPVNMLKSGEKDWRKAVMNEPVKTGDEIEVEEGGSVEIRLENGNSISLKENTIIKVTRLWYNAKTGSYENVFEAKYGKLKAVIERLDKKSKFEIKTPVAVCGARGTIMYLDITKRKTWASYEGGPGVVTSTISGRTVPVGTGQNATADDTGFITDARDTTNNERMSFDETWDPGKGVEGYSSPGDDTGTTPGGTDVTGGTGETGGTGGTGDTGAGDTGNTQEPFDDVPFEQGGGTSGQGGTYDFYFAGQFIRYNAGLRGFELAGSLTAGIDIDEDREIDPPDLAYLVQEGSYSRPTGYRLWTGDLTGTPDEGVNVRGWMSGNMASWESVLSALYIDSDGILGCVLGYLDDPRCSLFSGDGDSFIFPIVDGDTGYAPGDIYNDAIMTIEEITGNLAGAPAGNFRHEFTRVTTEDTGIWRGFYIQNSAGYIPNYVGNYYISKLSGTNDTGAPVNVYLLGRPIGSDSSMLYTVGMTQSEVLKSYLGMGVGETVPVSQNMNFNIATCGIYTQDEELFSVGIERNLLYDWTGQWEETGSGIGVTRLVSHYTPQERWAGYPSTFNSIGEFYNSRTPDESFVWYCDYDGGHPFSSYNPFEDTRVTSGGSSYYGLMGGASQSEWAFGNGIAIFLTPGGGGTYNAGLLILNHINGFYSDIIFRHIMEGDVETMQIAFDVGINPDLLYPGGAGAIEENVWDGPGNLLCDLPSGGSLNGTIDYTGMGITGQDWGIWGGRYHLQYNRTGNDSWIGFGTGDFVDQGADGDMYYALMGYDYNNKIGTMRMRMVGVSFINGQISVQTGIIDGMYDTYFHGVGSGMYFNEAFFPTFQNTYDPQLGIANRDILVCNDPPAGGAWGWGGDFDTAGGSAGSIDLDLLFGASIGYEDGLDGLLTGLCFLKMRGDYQKPAAPITGWNMWLGGHGYDDLSPNTPPSTVWFGNAGGNTWNSGAIDGTFKGMFFTRCYDDIAQEWTTTGGFIGGDGMPNEPVGKFIGHYVDGEDYTWEGICVAEWVEVTDLFDASTFDTISDFLFETPITELHSELLGGGAGDFLAGGTLTSVTFDLTVYQNAALDLLWTGDINGLFSGTTGPSWTVDWINGADQVTLAGDVWDPLTNQWHAAVSGTWGSYTFQEGSEAGGTFDAGTGTFTGIGAGTCE